MKEHCLFVIRQTLRTHKLATGWLPVINEVMNKVDAPIQVASRLDVSPRIPLLFTFRRDDEELCVAVTDGHVLFVVGQLPEDEADHEHYHALMIELDKAA